MTRRAVARFAMALLVAVIVADVIAVPPNPYKQPAVLALGSGTAGGGGFCGALPDD